MKQKYTCSSRNAVCKKKKCKGAFLHNCETGNESHGCVLYISQPFCKKVKLTKTKI
jgi:hypothetical protein